MKVQNLLDSSKYKSFIQDRNFALERINIHTQMDVSRLLFDSLDRVTHFVSHMAIQNEMSIHHLQYLSQQLDQYLIAQFHQLAPLIDARIKRMRKSTFIIGYLGELEAIARATQKTRKINPIEFKQKLHDEVQSDTLLGEKLIKRIWKVMMELRMDIEKAFHLGVVMEESPKEIVDRVKGAYPKIQTFKRPPRALKPIREAMKTPRKDWPDDEPPDEEDQEFEFYSDLVSEDEWLAAVEDYKATELPASRFDNEALTHDPEAEDYFYNWEIEQQATEDFVKTVRKSGIVAGQDLGIKDFIWVAIIDNKTDECCLSRSGKTSREIEAMLASGELDPDECDAVAAPGHFSCRCTMSPVASVDEVEGPDWKAFGDWLNS